MVGSNVPIEGDAIKSHDSMADDIAALTQLFERITDPDLRQSILLLVDALVASGEIVMPMKSL